jgi:hypothetical protein
VRGKLGKLPPKHNPKTLRFAKYLGDTILPAVQPKKAWEYVIPDEVWAQTMLGNDTVGDCTCAALGHILMAVSANTDRLIIPTTEQTLELYSAVTGYDPSKTQPDGTNPTDNGAAITDVLAYVQTNGLFGQKIIGWVQIDQTNRDHFALCVELFGAVDVGVQLPASAMSQFDSGQPWDVTADDGGIEGGHAIPYLGLGREGETCITWARRQPTGIPWFTKYADEAYGLVFEDWFDLTTGLSPSRFNRDALWADAQAIRSS